MGGYYRDRSPGRGYDRGYERRYDTGYDRGYGGYGGRGAERDIVREPPSRCSLLVRGLSRDTRGEDLRAHAEKYGKVRDVYMPVDYYTREPRGIGFVEFYSSEDAEEAKYAMDRLVILGREVKKNVLPPSLYFF